MYTTTSMIPTMTTLNSTMQTENTDYHFCTILWCKDISKETDQFMLQPSQNWPQ